MKPQILFLRSFEKPRITLRHLEIIYDVIKDWGQLVALQSKQEHRIYGIVPHFP